MTVASAPDANRSTPVTWVSTSTANVSPRRGPFSIVRRGDVRDAIAVTDPTGPRSESSAVT